LFKLGWVFAASRQLKKYVPFADWRALSRCKAASLRQVSGSPATPGGIRSLKLRSKNSEFGKLYQLREWKFDGFFQPKICERFITKDTP
jgi:hypothetical protein